MLDVVGTSGGGVGGMSPVTLQSPSIPAHSSFKAEIGGSVNTSRIGGEGGNIASSALGSMARPWSLEGSGGGGGERAVGEFF